MIKYNYLGPSALHGVSQWGRNIVSLKPGIWIRCLIPRLVRIPWPSIGLLLFISHITKKPISNIFKYPSESIIPTNKWRKLGFRYLSKLLRAKKPVKVRILNPDLLGSFYYVLLQKIEYEKQNAKLNLCLKLSILLYQSDSTILISYHLKIKQLHSRVVCGVFKQVIKNVFPKNWQI